LGVGDERDFGEAEAAFVVVLAVLWRVVGATHALSRTVKTSVAQMNGFKGRLSSPRGNGRDRARPSTRFLYFLSGNIPGGETNLACLTE
jgi:hypothetical protein